MKDKSPFILDTRRPLQDGTYPVKLSVGHGTHLYLSTGVSVEQDFFVAGRVEGRKDAKRLNGILDTQRLRVKARLLLLKEDILGMYKVVMCMKMM